MPTLVIVGGPNGSGKTTLTKHLIKRGRIKTHVINPDDIAKIELGSFNFRVGAAKLALERRHQALSINADFAFETTFSGKSEINDCIAAKAAGFKTILYYITLTSVMDNINRVEERELNLGHPVDVEDIARRYNKSKANLSSHISLFDRVYLFDNSKTERSRVAIFEKGELIWLSPKHKDHSFYKELLTPQPTPPLPQG
ncbi:zeta toxin family protein [Mucilaginibacter pedocola]|uniref:Zeta toxin domain-containing protein n=1 Tax=Mucilaginibacter pedocola TaxID=1792845 RepID=A0A1S9P9L1_9SPHI|nr:zeta toxin family protein [Mucilaginibacter pedocola]OOQ57642.1 hypothetical protein BC343_12630 [Mucilaginibacter pedocola]